MITKRKKRIAAWAVTATSAAFEISLVIWPDVIQHHWRYAFGLWAIAILLWIWSLITPKDEKMRKAPTIQESVQNSGQIVSPVFSGIEGSTFHQTFITTSGAPSEPSAALDSSRAPLPKAELIISSPEFPQLIFRMGKWTPYPSRLASTIIWVENGVAEQGESSEALSVAASLKSKDGHDNTLGHVSRAYWVGHLDNEITIGVGAREAIVLGTRCAPGLWEMYSNPSEPVIRIGRRSIMHFKYPRKSLVLFESGLKIEVSIISPDTAQTIKQFPLEVAGKADGTIEIKLIA